MESVGEVPRLINADGEQGLAIPHFPIVGMLPVDGWQYRAEGGKHVVFAYAGPRHDLVRPPAPAPALAIGWLYWCEC